MIPMVAAAEQGVDTPMAAKGDAQIKTAFERERPWSIGAIP